MTHWRAIQTKPRLEYLAVHKITSGLAIPVYWPTIEGRSLFPSYIFANFTAASPSQAQYLPGIVRIIGSLPIPSIVIEELRARMEEGPKLEIGKLYHLRKPGAFGELLVKLERFDKHDRAVVLMDLLGLQREITISADQLEPRY